MFAREGQSNMDANTAFHFVAYVNRGGTIWELDGRRNKPLQKGTCDETNFGSQVAKLLKGYVNMDDTCQISLMALSPNQGD